MRFGALVLKNLTRRLMRSALTLMALTTAIASVVSLIGIARGFTKSFGDIYAAHKIDIVVSRQGSADRLSSSIDEHFAEDIAALPSVDRAAAILLETMSLEDEGVYGLPAMGVAADSWILKDYEFLDQIDIVGSQTGTAEDEKMSPKHIFWLGIHLADRLGVKTGDFVNLFEEPYQVAGVYKSPATWENGAMIFPIDTLQELTDRDGQATYVNCVLAANVSGPQVEKAIQSIESLDSKLLPLATSEFVETDTRMQLAGAMAWMTSVIALVIGAIGTLNTMLTSVMERTKEIGILRAIGWPKSRVVRMILLESCGLTVLSSVIGTVLAVVLTWALSQAPMVKGILTPAIDGTVMLQGLGLALGIGLLGAILPAWRASHMLPTEAFREG